ncbi:hypothetical protein RKD44_004517 [Streptomyces collinus]
MAILYSVITFPLLGSMVWMFSWRASYDPHLRTATSFSPPP